MTKAQESFLSSMAIEGAEYEQVELRYLAGYLKYQCFYWDYIDLPNVYKEQMRLGLPLSSDQEDELCDYLGIGDEEHFFSRRDLIRRLSRSDLEKILVVEGSARMRILDRWVDGRLQGNISKVLDVAPKVMPQLGQEYKENLLVDKMIHTLETMPVLKRSGYILKAMRQELEQFKRMYESKLVDDQCLILVARLFMLDEERDHWISHMSFEQRLLKGKRIIWGLTGEEQKEQK